MRLVTGGNGSSRNNPTTLDQVALLVTHAAEVERLFRRVERILVAVSGGPDSVALLLTLIELRAKYGYEVIVCSFDHQLRDDSVDDLNFVRELCLGLGVACKTGEGDVRDMARRSKIGIEEAARTTRYQFLGFVAANERADCIATGHTADDQAETVLMNVVRGSGVRGIRGMLPSAPVPGSPGQRLIRPLLVASREQTVAICAEAGISPRLDASNFDQRYRRNQIRESVMDELAAINPSINLALTRLAANAREAFRPIERQADLVVPVERGPFGSVFVTEKLAALPSEGVALIEREAAFYGADFAVNHTILANAKAVLAKGSGLVNFGAAVLEASCGLTRISPPVLPSDEIPSAVLNVPGATRAGAWRIDVRTEPFPAGSVSASAAIDAASMKGALRVRPIAAGDKMRHRGKTKLLSDVLTAERVPIWERKTMLALADSQAVLAVLSGYHTITNAPAEGDDHLWVGLTRLA